MSEPTKKRVTMRAGAPVLCYGPNGTIIGRPSLSGKFTITHLLEHGGFCYMMNRSKFNMNKTNNNPGLWVIRVADYLLLQQ